MVNPTTAKIQQPARAQPQARKDSVTPLSHHPTIAESLPFWKGEFVENSKIFSVVINLILNYFLTLNNNSEDHGKIYLFVSYPVSITEK